MPRDVKTINLDDHDGPISLTFAGRINYFDKYELIRWAEAHREMIVRASRIASKARSVPEGTKTLLAVSKTVVALYQAGYSKADKTGISADQIMRTTEVLKSFDGDTKRNRPDTQVYWLLDEMKSWSVRKHETLWETFVKTAEWFMDRYGTMGVEEPDKRKISEWRKRKTRKSKSGTVRGS